MKSIVYYILVILCRTGIPFFFGRVEVNGRENIPENAPVIFAPNHRNAFMDAVLVVSLTFKKIHFLTRSDIFVKPFLWILDAMNMIPVYRKRDGYNQLSKNEDIFKKCQDILSASGSILIFPEAGQADTHYLRPLTKGLSRLAVQTKSTMDKELYIVPVGINYFHPSQPRHKVIVNFEKPLKISDYMGTYNSNRAVALNHIRRDLGTKIMDGLLIPEKDEWYDNKVRALHPGNEKLRFGQLRKVMTDMSFDRYTYRPGLKPLYIFLGLANWLPLLLIQLILQKNVSDQQFIGPLKFVLAIIFFPIWWIMVLVILLWTTGPMIAWISTPLVAFSLFLRQSIKNRTSPFLNQEYSQPKEELLNL